MKNIEQTYQNHVKMLKKISCSEIASRIMRGSGGQTKFVSVVGNEQERLMTIFSWDARLKIWEYLPGKELLSDDDCGD